MQNSVAVRLGRLAALGLSLSATVASASGIFFPENGSEILGRGGADVGFLDSSYALEFNPAGMALRDGLDVHADLMLLNPAESFKMANPNLNPDHVTVSNSGGISPGTTITVSYRPPSFRYMAFGIGLWSPPGALSYKFPDPANFSGSAASTQTPQRYNVITQNSVVLYPAVGVAVRPIKYISIGGTLEYVYSTTQLTEASQGLPSQDASLFGVNPNTTANDVNAKLNVTGVPRVSGVFGAVIKPIDDLTIAGSYQLYQPIFSKGTLDLTPATTLQSMNTVGLHVSNPNDATLAINLPAVARAGISYKYQWFHISAEYVWEGWGVNNQFTPTTNATISSSVIPACKGSSTATCIPSAVKIAPVVNKWHNTNGIRGGVGFDVLSAQKTNGFNLQINAGASYDPNAIPYETQTLPYITGDLIGASAGAIFDWKGFGIAASFMYFVPQTITVSNSIQYRTATVPDVAPENIGNGVYQTNFWMLGVGLHYHWDQT